jgi:hypothetical protein
MADKKKTGPVLLIHDNWDAPKEFNAEHAANIMEIQRTKKDAGIRYFKETTTGANADNIGDQKGDKRKKSKRTDAGDTARKEG